MERPKSFLEAFKNTILARALKKASQEMSMDQDQIVKWGKLPRSVRMKMSADDVAEWRRQNSIEKR
jgi:hypothetical protein